MHYILASQSPRRRELLSLILPSFEVRPADIDESLRPGAPLQDEVVRLAAAKASAVARACPGATVIGSDTIVTIDGLALGKPRDPADAARMLRLLSGRTHRVLTGAAVVRSDGAAAVQSDGVAAVQSDAAAVRFDDAAAVRFDDAAAVRSGAAAVRSDGAAAVQSGCAAKTILNVTEVTFRPLSDAEIDRYVASGDPLDKAGAYGIQGRGAVLVRSICGDFYSVMGLPVAQLYEILCL